MVRLKITSLSNEAVRQAIDLRDARHRREYKLTVIDGAREIQRALEANWPLEHVFVCPSLFLGPQDKELLKALELKHVKIIEVTDLIIQKMSFGQRIEPFLAVAKVLPKVLSDFKPSGHCLYVMAQGIEKPGNIGAILRTCDAVGVDGLILIEPRTDLFNPNVIRASTGTVFSVPVAICDDDAALKFIDRYKIKTCGLFPQSEKSYTDVDLTTSVALVLGSEDQGLSALWQKAVSQHVCIPMKGRADSLNVSVCAAIVMYEAIRQRQSLTPQPALRRSAKKF